MGVVRFRTRRWCEPKRAYEIQEISGHTNRPSGIYFCRERRRRGQSSSEMGVGEELPHVLLWAFYRHQHQSLMRARPLLELSARELRRPSLGTWVFVRGEGGGRCMRATCRCRQLTGLSAISCPLLRGISPTVPGRGLGKRCSRMLYSKSTALLPRTLGSLIIIKTGASANSEEPRTHS